MNETQQTTGAEAAEEYVPEPLVLAAYPDYGDLVEHLEAIRERGYQMMVQTAEDHPDGAPWAMRKGAEFVLAADLALMAIDESASPHEESVRRLHLVQELHG